MSVIAFNKKDDLIAALEARRPWAKALDKPLIAKHKADEKAALDSFRAECRAAAKKSYAELSRGPYSHREVMFRGAVCPMLTEAKLDMELAAVKASQQQRFTITNDRKSKWSTLHWLLTHDETLMLTPC